MATEGRLVARGWGWGLEEPLLMAKGVSFWSDDNVLQLDSSDDCTTL